LSGPYPSRERLSFFGCGAAAAFVVVLAYANHFHNAFHFDDSHTLENNLYVRDLKNVPLFFRSAKTFSSLPSNQSYRPLVTTTLAIDYRLAGRLDPFWFHVTNFSLFAVQSLLLYFLFRRILDAASWRASNRWTALFGAAWYGLHAANAETVNYIISRSDILSTLGVTGALLLYAVWPAGRRTHLYLLPAALGVLAKESAAMFGPLLFLYVGLLERQLSVPELLRPRNFASVFVRTLPAFAVGFGMVAFAMKMTQSWSSGGGSHLQYLLTQPFVMVHYFLTFFLPFNLSADTDWTVIANPLDDRVIIGATFVIATVAAAVRASRGRETRPIAFGILWFFVALLPTSSFVPFSEVLNDHRTYFPYVGLMLAVCSALQLLLERSLASGRALPRASALGAAVLLLSGHAYGTHQRNLVWRTEESLWLDVTRKSPGNGRGWMNYGLTRMSQGHYPEAIRCFERALATAPLYGYAHANLAIALSAVGQPAAAERHFRAALDYQPDVPSLRFFYARWLDQGGRIDEAARHLERALELSPADLDARLLLLKILAKQRDWIALGELARRTLEIEPGDSSAAEYVRMARDALRAESAPTTPEGYLAQSLELFQSGRYREVLTACDRALELRPDYAAAFNNKCAAYNVLERYAEAKATCERALQLKPDFQLAQNNLAIAQRALQR
jgi:protein O-mannosyl-transferase